MRKVLLASLAVVLASGPALAADLPPAPAPVYKAPAAVAPAYSWSGCYVDGGGGYGLWNDDHNTVLGGASTPGTTTGGRGWFGSVGAGCDYQMNSNWVVGLQGDYNFMNLHGTFTDPNFVFSTGNEKESWSWAIGGRIGYLVAPNVLAYFNGGFTQAHFDQTNLLFFGAPTTTSVAAQTYNGWFLGGGTETSLAGLFGLGLPPGLFLRSEYRFSSYQSENVPLQLNGVPVAGDFEHSTKYVQTIGTELVWKFNWH